MIFVCLMTMLVSVNAHNTHYPTYTEDGITYIKTGGRVSTSDGAFYTWDVLKVDKPNNKSIIIPSMIMIDGEKVKVREVRENAFCNCISLDSLIISDGVDVGKAFKGCKNLEYLYYSFPTYRSGNKEYYCGLFCKTLETYRGVYDESFWDEISGSLEKLIIRDTEQIKTRIDFCQNLKTIVCYATNPPSSNAATDGNYGCIVNFEAYQWSTITLYVPKESLEKYYFDSVWGEIDNIYPIEEMNNTSTSINSISDNRITYNVWYSLNGTKVDKPNKGVYINNGKKYIIK